MAEAVRPIASEPAAAGITQVLQKPGCAPARLTSDLHEDKSRMATARMSQTPAPALNNDGISWITAVFMALFHAAAIATLFFFAWKPFLVAMVLLYCSGSLGIGLGYHRLLTHRGYVTPKWVEYFLTICACTALEGG